MCLLTIKAHLNIIRYCSLFKHCRNGTLTESCVTDCKACFLSLLSSSAVKLLFAFDWFETLTFSHGLFLTVKTLPLLFAFKHKLPPVLKKGFYPVVREVDVWAATVV